MVVSLIQSSGKLLRIHQQFGIAHDIQPRTVKAVIHRRALAYAVNLNQSKDSRVSLATDQVTGVLSILMIDTRVDDCHQDRFC